MSQESKSSWLPISTAPQGTGERIIAYDPNYWGEGSGTSGEALWIGISNRWQLMRHPTATFNPTVWQPMPEPKQVSE